MTVRELLFHLLSLHSSFRPQPSTAFLVPSASLQQLHSTLNIYASYLLSL